MKVVSIRILFVYGLLLVHPTRMQNIALGQSSTVDTEHSTAAPARLTDPLLRLLVSKGLLTTEEAGVVLSSGPGSPSGQPAWGGGTSAQQRDRLATLLKDKGLISNAEFEALQVNATSPAPDVNGVNVNAIPSSAPTAGSQKSATAPSVIAAVVPIRLLPIEPQAREGLIPDLKLGSGARIKPYGYFKDQHHSRFFVTFRQ